MKKAQMELFLFPLTLLIAICLLSRPVQSFKPSVVRQIGSKDDLFRKHAVAAKGREQQSTMSLPLTTIDDASTTLHSCSMLTAAFFSNDDISKAFNVATFAPQILWVLLIAFPKQDFTKKIMGTVWPLILTSLVHFFIVVASATQENGTAPIAEFAGVFDPAGAPQAAMLRMMQYPNFVTEEWSHVLTWDLFVGQWIWLDGLRRGVFTSHSVLLTNLIGPPGFLLHMLTCAVTGKGLPPLLSSDAADTSVATAVATNAMEDSAKEVTPVVTAESVIESVCNDLYTLPAANAAALIAAACSPTVQWEDTALKETTSGPAAVQSLLLQRLTAASAGSTAAVRLVRDKTTDGGGNSGGFTWHLEVDGVSGWGLRGSTFLQLDGAGKIQYVREVVEPLLKPGSSIAVLLKAVSQRAISSGDVIVASDNGSKEKPRKTFKSRYPSTAEETVKYLWQEVQPTGDFDLVLARFADDIYYEDFNFPTPFRGLQAVEEFLQEFNFPGIDFIPEEISQGVTKCCFTWRVEIAGSNVPIRGVSFYEIDPNKDNKVVYVRDIPEPALKPALLQQLASKLRPGLRRFQAIDPVTIQ